MVASRRKKDGRVQVVWEIPHAPPSHVHEHRHRAHAMRNGCNRIWNSRSFRSLEVTNFLNKSRDVVEGVLIHRKVPIISFFDVGINMLFLGGATTEGTSKYIVTKVIGPSNKRKK